MKRLLPILFLLAVACSPEQRLANLLKHHPELKKNDTVFVEVPVLQPAVKGDSALKKNDFDASLNKGDTVVITKEKIVTKIFRVHDTIHVKTFMPADTIVQKIPVPVERIVVKEVTGVPWWVWVVIVLLSVAVLGLIFRK